MQVFDFDKTIYKNDSATDFYFFCLLRYPYLLLLLPYQAVLALLFGLGLLPRGSFKAGFYCFLRFTPQVEKRVQAFWRLHLRGVFPWYQAIAKEDDLVISASPRFLVEPACALLGIKRVLATEMDPKTGRIDGENCYGKEKVRRFRDAYPDSVVHSFYSDSYSDTPMAQISKESYLIKKDGRVTPWL